MLRVAGTPAMLDRGDVVDRYVILSLLGQGAMGVVYAAYDPELDRKVALKLLLPQAEGGLDSAGRTLLLLREAQALARLAHPNVVAIYDVGTHGEQVWIAMEFVAGQTLDAWAGERPRRWPEVLRILTDVSRGVAAAHRVGLVHRDLKPDNVMVDSTGRVRVMDFGLAHGRAPAAELPETFETLESDAFRRPEASALCLILTQSGAVNGTPAYLAPEQWNGDEASAATDQFGWGVMAWELLFGERPFAGATMAELGAAVVSGRRRAPPRGRRAPGWLRRMVERGLAGDPARRWPSMAALVLALERGRTRARLRTATTLLASMAIAGAGVGGYRPGDVARREAACTVEGAELDRQWNDGAAARSREGDLLEQTGAYEWAEIVSTEAYFEAAHAGAWEVAAHTATHLIFTVGYRLERHVDGREWARHAQLAIAHSGDPTGLLEADRLASLAVLETSSGAFAEGRRYQEQALELRERALARAVAERALALKERSTR